MRPTAAASDPRLPVVVVTGFLGSGKTTLLARMLASRALTESLVIVNEFGEVGIDHHLLERSDDRTILLDNGCLCCQLRGDLQELLVDITMRRRRGEFPGFDRVFIETSGLADPGPIAQTLYGDGPLARDYRLSHVVALVDASDSQARAAAEQIAARQVAAADLVVISKADRASEDQVSAAKAWVHRLNPFARREVATHGAFDPAVLDGALPLVRSVNIDVDAEDASGAHAALHSPLVSSFALTFDAPVPRGLFDEFLDLLVRLRGADLLRVKGILYFAGESAPVLIQGVQHVFDRHVELGGHAGMPSHSTLVFITHAIDRRQIESLWSALHSLSR